MPEYIVRGKTDGVEIYRYNADAPIEWSGMEFAEFYHAEWSDPSPDGSINGVVLGRTLTKLEYLRRFTTEERVAIRAAAKVNPVLDDYLYMLELSEEIDLADVDIISAVNMLEQADLIAAGRAQEILNG